MKTETVTVTRRTKNFGFAWTTEIESPSEPEYTGTLLTILRRAHMDSALQAVISGNVFYRQEFFVGGKRIVRNDSWMFGVDLLLIKLIDHLMLTVEE